MSAEAVPIALVIVAFFLTFLIPLRAGWLRLRPAFAPSVTTRQTKRPDA
ncbi:MAG: hypothetical protein V4707_07455 [Pseudomonadota bacterium]